MASCQFSSVTSRQSLPMMTPSSASAVVFWASFKVGSLISSPGPMRVSAILKKLPGKPVGAAEPMSPAWST